MRSTVSTGRIDQIASAMSDESHNPEHELGELLSRPARDSMHSILQLLDPLCIEKRIDPAQSPNTKYGAMIHSELCRLKMLGFSDANCARGVGINPSTLRGWFSLYPMLEQDMQQAAQLAKAEVAQLLFKCMNENGPVGLNAVKFYLSTRAEEFKEKQEVSVRAGDAGEEVENAIRRVYGIELDNKPAAALPQDAKPALDLEL